MSSYKIIEIYKGVAEYSASVAGLQFSNPIEKLPIALGISDLAIEKVEITSHVQNGKNKIILKFYMVGVENSDDAYNLTKDIADQIFSNLTYSFDAPVWNIFFDGAPISKEIVHADGRRSLAITPMPIIIKSTVTATDTLIPSSDRIEEFVRQIRNSSIDRNYYCSLYRFAFQSIDPISQFMILYGVLPELTKSGIYQSQKQVDDFIRTNEKGVREKPSRKSKRMETIYTYLRNEIGHPPTGKKVEDIRDEIKTKVSGLSALVKKAILQFT